MKQDNAQGGSAKALNVVFSEDFQFGLSGNSGFGPWTTDGPDGALWLYDTNGPNGDFSNPATEKIQSTTVSNGFMIFDTNLSNPGGVTTNRTGYLVSPVLDLSATPDVQLKLEQRFRWCCSGDHGHWVDVSTDGGFTWPYRISLGDGVLNKPTATNWDIGTHTQWIDISSYIAGNAGTVAFRFAHQDMTVPGISHYFWQIDDVQLIATPAYDPQFTLTQYDDFIPNNLVFSGNTDNLEYSIFPFGQLHPLALKGKIRNGGTTDLNNVLFNVTVEDAASNLVFNNTATINNLQRYAIDSAGFYTWTPPADTEQYTVSFHVQVDSTDEHPQDNDAVKNFKVDPWKYAMDDGAMNGRSNTQGGDEFEMCNKFYIHNQADAYAVSVAFAKKPSNTYPTPHGQSVVARLYDSAGAWVGITNEYLIDSTDLNANGQSKFVDLMFDPSFNMPVGEYIVCIYYSGGDPVWISTSGQSDAGASLDVRPSMQGTTPIYYVQNATPMIRLNFNPDLDAGIAEQDMHNGLGLGQNEPNPSGEWTAIPYRLADASAVRITVHDLSGKQVFTRDLGTRPSGTHRFHLDTFALADGVYFYTLTSGEAQLSKKMVVVR